MAKPAKTNSRVSFCQEGTYRIAKATGTAQSSQFKGDFHAFLGPDVALLEDGDGVVVTAPP
jgi:hypothetical protein